MSMALWIFAMFASLVGLGLFLFSAYFLAFPSDRQTAVAVMGIGAAVIPCCLAWAYDGIRVNNRLERVESLRRGGTRQG